MEISDVNLLSLLRTLEVLQPYLGEIVIVGGWVPFLYRKYGHVPSHHPSVRTIDIDVVVPRRLEENGRPIRKTITRFRILRIVSAREKVLPISTSTRDY